LRVGLHLFLLIDTVVLEEQPLLLVLPSGLLVSQALLEVEAVQQPIAVLLAQTSLLVVREALV
jgi:hypothetical protein